MTASESSVSIKPRTLLVLSGPALGLSIVVILAFLILWISLEYRASLKMVLPSFLFIALCGMVFAALGVLKLLRAKHLTLTSVGFTLGKGQTVEWTKIASIEYHWINNVKGGRFRDGLEIRLIDPSEVAPIIIPQIYCRSTVDLKSLLKSRWRQAASNDTQH